MDSYNNLVDYIMHYESDTFSSDDSNLILEEAEKLADALIQDLMAYKIDGNMLTNWLEIIRDFKVKEEEETEYNEQ